MKTSQKCLTFSQFIVITIINNIQGQKDLKGILFKNFPPPRKFDDFVDDARAKVSKSKLETKSILFIERSWDYT